MAAKATPRLRFEGLHRFGAAQAASATLVKLCLDDHLPVVWPPLAENDAGRRLPVLSRAHGLRCALEAERGGMLRLLLLWRRVSTKSRCPYRRGQNHSPYLAIVNTKIHQKLEPSWTSSCGKSLIPTGPRWRHAFDLKASRIVQGTLIQ